MKLTNREKILLPAALFIITAAIFINFVYLPLNNEINTLKDQIQENELRISESKTKQDTIQGLETQLKDTQQRLKTKHPDMLQSLDQPELLVFVEDILDSFAEKTSIDFFDAVSVQAVQAGEINIVFTADYENLQKVIRAFEEAKYYNNVTLFSIQEPETAVPGGEKLLEASLNVRFYSPRLSSSDPKDYSFMDDAYGKTNLFK